MKTLNSCPEKLLKLSYVYFRWVYRYVYTCEWRLYAIGRCRRQLCLLMYTECLIDSRPVIVAVFHRVVHNIHRDACRRNSLLHVPSTGTNLHATRDVEEYKALRWWPGHNQSVGRPPRRSKTRPRKTPAAMRIVLICIFVSFQLHCCGVTTYDDWRQHRIGGIIPSSCCQEINGKVSLVNTSLYDSLCTASQWYHRPAHFTVE